MDHGPVENLKTYGEAKIGPNGLEKGKNWCSLGRGKSGKSLYSDENYPNRLTSCWKFSKN